MYKKSHFDEKKVLNKVLKLVKRQCQQKPPELESGGSADRLDRLTINVLCFLKHSVIIINMIL